MDILDTYVSDSPSAQKVLDLFDGEWSSTMPEDSGLVARPGPAGLFKDDRIKWVEQQAGGVADKDILELGPLEGGHSYMLQNSGAKHVTAIEANSRAFLKCLCVKQVFGLENVSFQLGDFRKYLAETDRRFDIVVACGVLYHMTEPIALLRDIARTTDRMFLWTHYYDEKIIKAEPDLARKFQEPHQATDEHGFTYDACTQSYQEALQWTGFCGGSKPVSVWITKESILSCLKHLGFTRIETNFEEPGHKHGPAFALWAERNA